MLATFTMGTFGSIGLGCLYSGLLSLSLHSPPLGFCQRLDAAPRLCVIPTVVPYNRRLECP